MYIRKRGKGWRCEIEKRGVRLSLDGFGSKGAARTWGTEREAEIMAGVRGGIAGNHTLTDALERYRDDVSPGRAGGRWEKLRLDFFIRLLPAAGEYIDRVTPDQIGKYRDARTAGTLLDDGRRVKAVSGATVRRELNLLSGVFELARREWRWCASNPVRDVVKPEGSPDRWFEIPPDLEAKVLAAFGYVDGAMPADTMQLVGAAFALAIETGMRSGEILGLTTRTVDRSRRVAHLPKTKNGDARDVPLSKRAGAILTGLWPEGDAVQRLFPIEPNVRDQVFRQVRDATPAMQGMHFHDSRHEATKRLAGKLHVLDLARMLGHRDPKSLMHYYNTTAEELAAKL